MTPEQKIIRAKIGLLHASWPAKSAFWRVRACGRIERSTMLKSRSHAAFGYDEMLWCDVLLRPLFKPDPKFVQRPVTDIGHRSTRAFPEKAESGIPMPARI